MLNTYPPSFHELKSSTRTVMVYTNLVFDIEKLFVELPITTEVNCIFTKKKKNIDKKKLKAPYGAIISLQRDSKFRGLDLRKRKKRWCASGCRKIELRESEEVRINTVVEQSYFVEGTNDMYDTRYYCNECKCYYTIKQLDTIPTFLNQLTIAISIGHVILNIMMFKNGFKIAGCKENDDAICVSMILWKEYIAPILGGIPKFNIVEENDIYSSYPQFLFKLVMMNLDFKLGFPIDRSKLNCLMNKTIYSDKVYMSEYESTSHSNVNIAMKKKKTDSFYFDCMVIPTNPDGCAEEFFIKRKRNTFKTPKNNSKCKHTTFIVFSSSKIILSGKYEGNMKECYDFFIKEALKHREYIEECIKEPMNFIKYLEHRDYDSIVDFQINQNGFKCSENLLLAQ